MNRRNFLTQTCAGIGTMLINPCRLIAGQYPANEAVERVHVIFKTHLDLGFTDMAANVVRTYFEEFIPKVLSLTEKMAVEGIEDRYQWTTGSWLVYRYFEEASQKNRRRMEQAIERGDFTWLGVPYTTHTELIDKSLFKLALSYSAALDRRFGRKTLTAKMTDVPGHTRGLVPVMAEAGIELFHVGVNTGSTMPDVPQLFIWKSTDGAELTMMYHHDYGGVALLPGGKSAVSINFTSDNHGPHRPEQIVAIYTSLRQQFPQAKVFASDFNAVAKEVRSLRGSLPVVTQEIGDTWIHGAGSDPLLMARFRELSRLRNEWIGNEKLEANGDTDKAFGIHLLNVPEHTWGYSIGQLKQIDVYDMPAFREIRNLPEIRLLEESWADKRANIQKALATLPAGLKAEAESRLESLKPKKPNTKHLRPANPQQLFKTQHFKIGFDTRTGAINYLEDKLTQRQWASPSHVSGLFSYQTFSTPDFRKFMKQYVTPHLLNESWILYSWDKPGLEKSQAKSALYVTSLKQIWFQKRKDGYLFLSQLEIPEAGDSGCPKEIFVETFLPNSEPVVKITLKWFGKQASRLPEACWFSFLPIIQPEGEFFMDKMGQAVSPLDVVKGGNRNLHGVIDGVSYRDTASGFMLETPDAFLVAPGRRALLDFDNQQPDMTKGLHFCLVNNLTGTNFTMWFEDDMQFRFNLKMIV